MRNQLKLAAIAFALGTAGANAADNEASIPSVETVLANPPDNSAYVPSVRCLTTGRYRQVDIVSNSSLIFHGRGGQAWVNQLPRPCPGLHPNMALSIQTRGSRAAIGTPSAACIGRWRPAQGSAHWGRFIP